ARLRIPRTGGGAARIAGAAPGDHPHPRAGRRAGRRVRRRLPRRRRRPRLAAGPGDPARDARHHPRPGRGPPTAALRGHPGPRRAGPGRRGGVRAGLAPVRPAPDTRALTAGAARPVPLRRLAGPGRAAVTRLRDMARPTRWFSETSDGHSAWYIERFRAMAAQGADLAGEARLIDAMVPRGARLLDAGCG